MVTVYLQCGVNTNFDVVQFLAALDVNLTQQPNDHDQMTAVIRYYAPYWVNNKGILILLFALGDDIYLCTVLRLYNLLSMKAIIDLLPTLSPVLSLILIFH